MRPLALVPALTLLAACGAAEPTASERLENAAEQSTPEAASVLNNAANALEGQDPALPPSDPDSPVQNAMERAGNAQVAAPAPGEKEGPPPQAKPREPGDPVPPPKVTPTPES